MIRTFIFALALPFLAQNPYTVAGDHYHLAFENAWVRATRVTYGPHDKAPVHAHPSTPTVVYVYVTDGGIMRFRHITGNHVAGVTIDRKPVKAGSIRFGHGAPETHEVEYLGDAPTEYARIELRTEPLDRPVSSVRLPPLNLAKPGSEIRFQNGQVRLIQVLCAAGQPCPPSEHPADPAVEVHMTGPEKGQIDWSPAMLSGPAEFIRVELKTKPVS